LVVRPFPERRIRARNSYEAIRAGRASAFVNLKAKKADS
jgi:hypothetical protein